jgi:hypothetical protein
VHEADRASIRQLAGIISFFLIKVKGIALLRIPNESGRKAKTPKKVTSPIVRHSFDTDLLQAN